MNSMSHNNDSITRGGRSRCIQNLYIVLTNGGYVSTENSQKLGVGHAPCRRMHDAARRYDIPIDDWEDPESIVRFCVPGSRCVRHCLRKHAEQCGYVEGVARRKAGRPDAA